MFNKKRIFVFVVFVLLLFFMMTFGSSNGGNGKINTRSVKFIDAYDNTVISNQTIEVGRDAKIPNTPIHDGCDFTGWYTDNNVKTDDFTSITDDLTVYAKCNWKYYTVTFYDTIAKKTIDTQKVRYGKDAKAPVVPTHANYTFDGWSRGYKNVKSNFRVDAIYSTKTIAKYYTVKFYDNDTEELISTQTIKKGLSATFPAITEHKNRVYDYYEGNYTNVTEDRIITIYYKDAEKFNVTFNNGTHGLLNDTEEKVNYSVFVNNTFAEGNVVTPSVKADEGYTFDKWDVLFSDDTVVTKDIVITATYTANTNTKYTVEHYQEDLDGTTYTKVDTETLDGTTDSTAEYAAKSYEGFNYDSSKTTTSP